MTKATDLYPTKGMIFKAINGNHYCICQMLEYYNDRIQLETKMPYYFKDNSCSQEDAIQEVKFQFVRSLQRQKKNLESKF